MADIKFSELIPLTSIPDTALFPLVSGGVNQVVSWENTVENMKEHVVDIADGKINATQVEIAADATEAGDRALIMRLTASQTRILEWTNADAGFRLSDQDGSALYPLEIADGTLDSHAATRGQAARHNLSGHVSNYSVTTDDLGKVLLAIGALTFTLPDSLTLGDGWCCYVENISSTDVLTLATTSQYIDGAPQITLGPKSGCFLHTLGAPGFGTIGRKAEYILLRDQKSANTAGGTFTSGAWRTRDLNTEAADTGGNCALSANQFTLQPGTYRIRAHAAGFRCGVHKTRLYNTTDSTATLIGSSDVAESTNGGMSRSFVEGRFSISAAKTFELQHQCGTTRATDGFGVPSNVGAVEVYSVVELWKEI